MITLLTRFGMHVRLAHPEGYDLMPECVERGGGATRSEPGGSFTSGHDMDEAFADADIVYPKSWGPYDLMLERVEANRARRRGARWPRSSGARSSATGSHTDWICDERRMGLDRGTARRSTCTACPPTSAPRSARASWTAPRLTWPARRTRRSTSSWRCLAAAKAARSARAGWLALDLLATRRRDSRVSTQGIT